MIYLLGIKYWKGLKKLRIVDTGRTITVLLNPQMAYLISEAPDVHLKGRGAC